MKESVLACNPKNSTIYMGAINNKQDKKSSLYQLKYQQQNPRKSQIKSKLVNGSIKQITSLADQEQNLLIITKNDNKFQLLKENLEIQHGQNKLILSSDVQIYLNLNKQSKKCFLVQPTKIFNFDLQKLQKEEEYVNIHNQNQNDFISSCTVDPIHEFLTYVKNNREIIITDKTFKKQKYGLKIGEKDPSLILSLDYNPNKQYYLMTTHYQCLKFWDIRKPSLPIKVHSDHHSILLSSKYNHSHDQLICCSYDDGTVGLMRMSSVSSAPSGQNQDVMVKLYDQHQDSVYNVQWCSFSPWFFGSLSYSAANLVVNVVPNVQKYRILL